MFDVLSLVGAAANPDEIRWREDVVARIPNTMDLKRTPKALLPEDEDGRRILDFASFETTARRLRDRVDMFPWLAGHFHSRQTFDKKGLARYARYYLEQHPDGDATIVPDSDYEKYAPSVLGVPLSEIASLTVGVAREIGAFDSAIVMAVNRVGDPNTVTLAAFAALDEPSGLGTDPSDPLVCKGQSSMTNRNISVPLPFEAVQVNGVATTIDLAEGAGGVSMSLYDDSKGYYTIKTFGEPITIVNARRADVSLEISTDGGLTYSVAESGKVTSFPFSNDEVNIRRKNVLKGYTVTAETWSRVSLAGETVALPTPEFELAVTKTGTYRVEYTLLASDGTSIVRSAEAECVVVPVAILRQPAPETIYSRETQDITLEVTLDSRGDTEDEWSGQWYRRGLRDEDFTPVASGPNYTVEKDVDRHTLVVRNVKMRPNTERGAAFEFHPSHPSYTNYVLPFSATTLLQARKPTHCVVREFSDHVYSAKPTLVKETRIALPLTADYTCEATRGNYVEFEALPLDEAGYRTQTVDFRSDDGAIGERLTVEKNETIVGKYGNNEFTIVIRAVGVDRVLFREIDLKGFVGSSVSLRAPGTVGTNVSYEWNSSGLVSSVSGNDVSIGSGANIYYNPMFHTNVRIIFFDDGHDYSNGGASIAATGLVDGYNDATGILTMKSIAGSISAGQRWCAVYGDMTESTSIAYSPTLSLVNLVVYNKDAKKVHHVKYNLSWTDPATASASDLLAVLRQPQPNGSLSDLINVIRVTSPYATIVELGEMMTKYNFAEERAQLLAE